MVRHCIALVGSAAIFVLAASPSSGQESNKSFEDFAGTVVENYIVPGTTEQEIRRELNARGPLSKEGEKRFDAYAAYRFSWQTLGRPGESCEAKVDFTSVVTFPQLEDPDGLSPSVRRKWDKYVVELRRHEVGHLEITYSLLPAAKAAFESVPCETGTDRMKMILTKLDELHAQFDELTDHGKKTGARFP